MLKDDHQKTSHQSLEQDLQFMLSSIRARQNTLILYLQKLKTSINKKSTQIKLQKNEFQQKDKIYSRQIGSILQKHSNFSLGSEQQVCIYQSSVRAFWIKLKTILKVSVERIFAMGTGGVIEKLLDCYEKALITVQRISQSQKSLLSYKEVQNLFKKRTLQTILYSQQTHSPSISYSETKMQKNRSQTLFKPDSAISKFTIETNMESQLFQKRQNLTIASKQKLHRHEYIHGLANIKEEDNLNSQPKIKSLNRIKNRRPDENIKANIMNFIKVERLGKLKSTSKASQKQIKKIKNHVQLCEKNFQGAFDGKYEVATLLDKKKTIFENIYLLYDDLFAKNIPNHKMISKFMFNTTKINQLLYNAYEKKKRLNRKEKTKDKQRQKENGDAKEKQSNNERKKKKQKQRQKQKQKQRQKQRQKQMQKGQIDDKQKNHTTKHSKLIRKHHFIKEHQNRTCIFGPNTKQRQQFRDKKESQTTAITSKHHGNLKEFNHQKHQKFENFKEKEKKIIRSKTAKIKFQSEIQNPHAFVVNQNFIIGKHFSSQSNGQKTSHKTGISDKIVKTIVS